MNDSARDTTVGGFNKPDDAALPHRWLHIVNAVLVVGLWAFVVMTYGTLPEEIPHHMGAGGEVTRTGGRGIWLLMPILMSVNLVVMYGIAMSPMTAAGFNVPHKKRLMELPREQQAYALEPGRSFMLGMATWLVVISWLIQLEMYYAAFNGHGTGYALPVLIFFTLLPVAGAWWLSRAVKRRIEELESAA